MVERFWKRVDARGDDECWDWIGATDTSGYGMVRVPGPRTSNKRVRSSRFAWEIANGPIPDGLHVLHSCDNTRCCNIRHLRLGTAADNTRDKMERGRHHQANRTACANGHTYTEATTYIRQGKYGPQRHCRPCRREAKARYEAKTFIPRLS
jgi:hypothetical protein